ncbi:MAG: hypothetical protein INQ03_19965 [Candidatus Heimdallarchaeota archaeon]|nr:hypothetical protein [Candidatus Heimdallarchaeota archaeon]
MPSYRSSNMIILSILEEIIGSEYEEQQGILKSHIIKNCQLKSTTAEKYLEKMEQAEYIMKKTVHWGERETFVYRITVKGLERYTWFFKINTELE